MLKAPTEFIAIFILISVLLILVLVVFISTIIYRYQQKQNTYLKDIESLNTSHENTLLKSQLEIQEQTFQKISREIHDNIGQKLTLAKLHLNTLLYADISKTVSQVSDSVNMIGEAINDLSDISRSMSSEILLSNGLIEAVELEINQVTKTGLYEMNFSVTGNPVFLSTETELVLFRIVQEVLNNIIKHANASVIDINLHYGNALLTMQIKDNGQGFCNNEIHSGTGLRNIKKRTDILQGHFGIDSSINVGTHITIEIPLHESSKEL